MNPKETGRPEHYFDPEVVRDYDRRYSSGLGKWKHARKLKVLRRWLSGAGCSLEVACGPGRWRAAFEGHRVVHSDLSAQMLHHFRGLDPDATLVRANADRLPFPDGAFDAVVSIRFVSHLRGVHRKNVLTELARVSRRYVIIDARHVYNFRFWSRWIRFRLGLARANKLRHTIPALALELREVGLKLVETRSVAWGVSGRVLLRAERMQTSSGSTS